MRSWTRVAAARVAGVIAAAVAAGAAVSACTNADPTSNGSAETIRFVTPYGVKSLDPATQGLWAPEWGYGELFMRAAEDGTVQPWLLERLTSDNPTIWTLAVRAGTTFQNAWPHWPTDAYG